MNLINMIDQKAVPARIRRELLKRFDAVETVEADRQGWYDMECWQGWGEDARLRLRIRFIWLPITGWNYSIHAGNRP